MQENTHRGFFQYWAKASVTSVGSFVVIGTLMPFALINDPTSSQIAKAFLFSLAGGVITSFAVALMNYKKFIKPNEQVIYGFEKLVNGDISENSEIKEEKLGNLSTAFNAFVKSLRERIEGIRKSVSHIYDINTANLEEIDRMNKDAKDILFQIRDNQGEMISVSETFFKISGFINDLSAQNEEVIISTKNVFDNAMKTQKLVDESGVLTKGTEDSIIRLNEKFGDVESLIVNFNEKTKKISKMVSMIQEVAERTNLLALNAAVEASRAGEHGRGFSVVAEEVKKLADQSSLNTKQIESIINEIAKESESISELIKNERKFSEETKESFMKMRNHQMEMMSYIKGTNEQTKEILDGTSRVGVNIDEANERFQDIKKQIDKCKNVITHIENSANNMNNNLSTYKENVKIMNEVTKELEETIKEYIVD